jgi:hypothetical protein
VADGASAPASAGVTDSDLSLKRGAWSSSLSVVRGMAAETFEFGVER